MSAVFDFYQTLGWGLSALVIGTFLLAGTVKGVIGLGLPTVAMGLLGLVMLPPQAAALLIIPSAFTNVWQLATGGSLRPLLKRLW
ncbi:membrane protein, partial [Pseudomonas syringae pv. actinidiae ICMP 19101]